MQVLWVEDEAARQQVTAQQSVESVSEDTQPYEVEQNSFYDSDEAYDSEEATLLGNVREQAANVLSRGEKKLLITALRLSQLPLLATAKDKATNSKTSVSEDEILPLVLLDDITAELDDRALTILLKSLSQLSCQVFITSLEPQIMDKIGCYWPQAKLFHVKQGQVAEETKN